MIISQLVTKKLFDKFLLLINDSEPMVPRGFFSFINSNLFFLIFVLRYVLINSAL